MPSIGTYTSKVSKARPNTISLRTTVPTGVAKAIDLKERDTMEWEVHVEQGRIYVIVTKSGETL